MKLNRKQIINQSIKRIKEIETMIYKTCIGLVSSNLDQNLEKISFGEYIDKIAEMKGVG